MWFAILSTSFTFCMAAISMIKELDYRIVVATVDLSKYCIYMIIGVIFTYMVKSFFGKYFEEKNKMIKSQSPKDWSDENETVVYDDDIIEVDNEEENDEEDEMEEND